MTRPRLFVSAVSSELAGARRRTAAWLHGLGYDTTTQDDFPLGPGELRAWIERQIDGCDGLFQLLGDAYGAEPPDCADPARPWPDPRFGRCSYTQYELLYARARGLPTWVIEVGPGCRDTPPADLDLPPARPGEPPHPDPLAFQRERADLQRAWRARLRADNHLRHKADNDDQLELRVKGLRDELAELRRQDEAGQRRLIAGILAILLGLGVLGGGLIWYIDWRAHQTKEETVAETATRTVEQLAEQQRITTARIREHLQQAVEGTYQRDLAAAGAAPDWQQRERLRQAAAAQRDAQLARIDDLAASFTEIERQGQASEVFQELTRILGEQGIDAGLAYIAGKRPAILADVARIAADRERLLAHAEQRIRDTLQPLLTAAGVAETEGRFDTARDLYQTVLAQAPDWPDALQRAMLFHEAQGNQALILGSVRLFEAEFTAAYELAKHRARLDPANPDWQRDLSVSHNKLGDVAVAQGRLDDAAAAYGAGLAICESLAARDLDNTQWQRDLSVSHEKLGDVAVAQGRLDAAAAAYGAGLAIREALAARDPANTEWQRDLSLSHSKLGNVAVAQGRLDAAAAVYGADLVIAEALAARDPANTEWQRDLSVSHEKLGDVAVAQGRLDDAAAAYGAGLAIRETLAAGDPANTQSQRDLSVSHNKLGDVAVAQGRLDAAAAAYGAGLAIREALAARDPANTQWQRDLYVSHWKLADLAERRGDEDGAMTHWRAAHGVLQGIADRGLHVSPGDRGLLEQLTLRLRLIDEPAAVAAEFDARLAEDPDNRELYDAAQSLYHELLHDFGSAHRLTAAWVARHPEDLAVRCNLAETLLTSGQTGLARDALAGLLDPTGDAVALPPDTTAALHLLELAALTRLAGDGDAAAGAALPTRRAELLALLDAQPDDFVIGWTFDGTRYYLATDAAFAPHRDALLPLLDAAAQGRDALREQLRRAP